MLEIHSEKDTRTLNISTRLLILEALRKGYVVTFFPSSLSAQTGLTRCEKQGKELFFKSTCTGLTPSYGVFSAENKLLTHEILSNASIGVPETVALPCDEALSKEAIALLKKYKKVVVKPAQMNHGDGVTIGVTSKKKLLSAVKYARRISGGSSDVLVQQQVEGKEYRFLVAGGKVIAVAHRSSPKVIGDGISTIEQLVEDKNRDPRRGPGHLSELTRIDRGDIIIHRGAKFLDYVPKVDELVQVLDTSNLSRGGESIDYTNSISKAHKKLAIDAASATHLGIAGVDIMSTDIASEDTQNSYVIEVNLSPGLRMHQFPTVGKPIDVARILFRHIEHTARPTGKILAHIGKTEEVTLLDFFEKKIPARIDTGAALSSIWASGIRETNEGLEFSLFDKQSDLFSGEVYTVADYSKHAVSSSMGQTQIRYKIRTLLSVKGKRIRASVTLADRSTQVYPILIGRNIIRNKFIVDVSKGTLKYLELEKKKRTELDAVVGDGSL